MLEKFLYKVTVLKTSHSLRVLDCGVGTGSFTLAFTHACKAQVRIEAVDISQQMLKQAQQRLERAGYKMTTACADVRSLPYPDNQFDVVLAAHVMEHLPDPVVAIKEISRVLKPGDWLIICFTRQSIIGRYIQLKWRTHRLTEKIGEAWLKSADLNTHRMNLGSHGNFRLTSLICIGSKPNVISLGI